MSHYFNRQGSEDIGLESHNFPLTEYLTINNATNIWNEPRHPAYISKTARLMSYTDWPHGMNPSPDSLSAAGFYFSGKKKYNSLTGRGYYTIVILVLLFFNALRGILHFL